MELPQMDAAVHPFLASPPMLAAYPKLLPPATKNHLRVFQGRLNPHSWLCLCGYVPPILGGAVDDPDFSIRLVPGASRLCAHGRAATDRTWRRRLDGCDAPRADRFPHPRADRALAERRRLDHQARRPARKG